MASVFWASAAIFYRKGLNNNYDPWIANFFRAPLAFLILFFICIYEGILGNVYSVFNDLTIILFITAAVFVMNIVGDILYLGAIRSVGVSVAYPLSYAYPLAVAFITSAVLGMPVRYPVLFGVTLLLFGIYIMSRDEMAIEPRLFLGILLALGASFSWAVGIVIYSLLVAEIDPLVLGTVKLAILMLMSTPILPIIYRNKQYRNPNSIFILFGGLLGIGVGDLIFYVSLNNISATTASALTTSSPFLSQILAYLFLDEKFTKGKIIGTLLIVIGIIIVILP